VTGAPLETAVARYVIDNSVSRFTVRAFVSGLLSALGHNPTIAIRDFTGEVSLEPAAVEKASLRIQIRADSLEVTGDISSKDRNEMESMMKEKVLEISKYPEIVFETTAISADQLGEGRYKVNMNGDLSLHGVTRSLPVTAQVALNGDMLRAYGECSILQSNYGIPLVSVAGGTLKLKDELKFTFDIVARKQE
jgi:polyisoprenoid-binding protein YceI